MKKQSTDLLQCAALIKALPCFHYLSDKQCQELAVLFKKVAYLKGKKIVVEHQLVDAIFIVVKGQAEVVHDVVEMGRQKRALVAVILPGECIGLRDIGFYSSTGRRTATVVALTDMFLLRLEVKRLSQFLDQHHFRPHMQEMANALSKMLLIKRSLPFFHLSDQRLQWLAKQVEIEVFAEGEVIFYEQESADRCYLIHVGQVEIVTGMKQKGEIGRPLTLLNPPAVFGEATFMTQTVRNATAIAKKHCELFILKYQYLDELFATEKEVAEALMQLMLHRSRPKPYFRVVVHQRMTADNQPIAILKQLDNYHYCQLSSQGLFVWEQLNGERTMQEITLKFSEKFNVFSPAIIAQLITDLARLGFVTQVPIAGRSMSLARPGWASALLAVRRAVDRHTIMIPADRWISLLYQYCFFWIFTWKMQLILGILAVSGGVIFMLSTQSILTLFSTHYENLIWVLGLIPLSWLTVGMHELGHAMTAKAFGREIHYIGLGWGWFSPVIFIDTSDMWLATRGQRMLVNVAGLYTDILVAGLIAIMAFNLQAIYLKGMLWLFACFTYLKVFSLLNPAQETDGYFILMDGLNRSHLRQSALVWLIQTLPRALKKHRLKIVLSHRVELFYWGLCLLFFILVPFLAWIVQSFIFKLFGIRAPNIYFLWIIPFITTVLSGLRLIAEMSDQLKK